MLSLTCQEIEQCPCCGPELFMRRSPEGLAVAKAARIIRDGGHVKMRRRRQGVALMIFCNWWATNKPFRLPEVVFLCRDAAELDAIGAAIVAAV